MLHGTPSIRSGPCCGSADHRRPSSLLLAPAALAHDQGQGWYGETDDKVVTNAGFILIGFFPLFILLAVAAAVAPRQAQGRAQEGREGAARRKPPVAGRLVAARPRCRTSPASSASAPPPSSPSTARSGRNAVDGPTADALLEQAFDAFEADDEARVLVVTGAGGVAFCAGADLKAIDSFGAAADEPGGPFGFTRRTPSKPTIAAISGWCLAGGFELALWCDLRIATEGSKLGFPERRWGVPLIDGGTQRLPRIVGLGRALDLILTGRIIDAAEALAMGLLTEVVDDGPPPRPRAGDRRGARGVPAGDDARRPPRGDRGLRACRWPTRWPSRPRPARDVFADAQSPAPRASPAARAAAARAPAIVSSFECSERAS